MFTGPFGTGKTTLSRLVARALLCEDRRYDEEQETRREKEEIKPLEPCGECSSCRSLDQDNHPGYIEVDAASQGLVSDVRSMKDLLSYGSLGDKVRIICYDESHMMSHSAQNALLQALEEGIAKTVFSFCTTESNKMLPTIRSRCVELRMKLLTMKQIYDRLKIVARDKEIDLEEKAGRIISSYVRGHVRDALILLEQLAQMSSTVTEEMVRNHLRLDKFDAVYALLTETDRRRGVEQIEDLLCNFSAAQLSEVVGEVLVNAYKQKLGLSNFTQVDDAWLRKVNEVRGGGILGQAERVLTMETDYSSINYGIAVLARILFEEPGEVIRPERSLMPVSGVVMKPGMSPFRKPGRE